MPHSRSEELCELAYESDAAGVLSIVTIDEIAQEWCAQIAAIEAEGRDREPGPEEWPVWFVMHCLGKVPHVHRELLLKLVAHAPSDDVLATIGAGPFEDWLYSSPDEISWLEAEASKDPRFQRALDNMRY